MIDYDTHKQVLMATGLSEEAFLAQRNLIKMGRRSLIRDLKRAIQNVPDSELKQGPSYIRQKFYQLLEGIDQ